MIHILERPASTLAVAQPPGPFLKWAGGKSRLLPQFRQFFPVRYGRYYEPFLGGGAVFFDMQPPQAVLNDLNPALIGAYRHIQGRLDELLHRLKQLRAYYYDLMPSQRQAAYYRFRQHYNELPHGTLEKTVLLIVLNKTCYNGLYRENARGQFNVPYGRYEKPLLFREEQLRAVRSALHQVELLNTHFATASATACAGDFIYFDPPYAPVSATASFTRYYRRNFGLEQHAELAQVARKLAERGVQVMLSNADVPLVRELYADFHIHTVQATRAINSKPWRRGKIGELVITSYSVE